MNIDILCHQDSFDYNVLLASFGFNSLVTDPTRIQGSSISCLDHVFIKVKNNYDIRVNNIPANLTDHNLIEILFDLSISVTSSRFSCYEFTKIDYVKLRDLLFFESWNLVYNADNCSSAFCNFITILSNHISLAGSKVTARKRTKLKPWMTSELLTLSDQFKKYNLKLIKHPLNLKLKKYVLKLKVKTKVSIKAAKEAYFKSRFNNAKDNPKHLWQTADEIMGRKVKNCQIFRILSADTKQLITSPKCIAEEFNNFFLKAPNNIASSSSSVLNYDDEEYRRFVLGSFQNPNSFFCTPFTPMEILREIHHLENKKSKGMDGVDNVTLKNVSWFIIDVLCYIFNFSRGVRFLSSKRADVLGEN